MLGVHPDLRRYTALIFVSSAAVGSLGLLMLVAVAMGLPAVKDVPAWLTFVSVTAFLAVGYVGTVLAPRWYREASRIVSSVQPTRASATFRLDSSSDSTSLYARIESAPNEEPLPSDDVSLLIPRWDLAPIFDSPIDVSVFVDPATLRVVAVATRHGLLWSMPHWSWAPKNALEPPGRRLAQNDQAPRAAGRSTRDR